MITEAYDDDLGLNTPHKLQIRRPLEMPRARVSKAVYICADCHARARSSDKKRPAGFMLPPGVYRYMTHFCEGAPVTKEDCDCKENDNLHRLYVARLKVAVIEGRKAAGIKKKALLASERKSDMDALEDALAVMSMRAEPVNK